MILPTPAGTWLICRGCLDLAMKVVTYFGVLEYRATQEISTPHSGPARLRPRPDGLGCYTLVVK